MRLTVKQKYKIGLQALNLTQDELGKELGYSKSYITMLLNGQRKSERFQKWMEINVMPLFKYERSAKK